MLIKCRNITKSKLHVENTICSYRLYDDIKLVRLIKCTQIAEVLTNGLIIYLSAIILAYITALCTGKCLLA